jgi:hypothetical protein
MLKPMLTTLKRTFWLTLIGTITMLVCQQSSPLLTDPVERVRVYTRSIEFDYVTWTLDSIGLKVGQAVLGLPAYIRTDAAKDLVKEYAADIQQKQRLSDQILQIYSDPNITNPAEQAAQTKSDLSQVNARLDQISPTAESILQAQLSAIIVRNGLGRAGAVMPPVAFHATPLPYALIISPRYVIRQDADISLISDLSLDQMIALEQKVSKNLNVSALVEEVGGIGTYPTMVQQTSDLNWLAEVVAHEWTHNYLTFRPLGLNYETTPELRTMNETTASIAGKELGALLIEEYYPELAPKPVEAAPSQPAQEPAQEQEQLSSVPVFDFRAVMHETRVKTDELLAAGRIDEAETYMESQRKYIWENGYLIRKLNQAYFAFHGAYADSPGGAAGEDPVGPAVRSLRSESKTLADFVNRISWMTSFEQLQKQTGQ